MAIAGGMDASGLCRRQPRGPMSRAPGSHRLIALLGALGLIVAVAAPAFAADPKPGTDTRLRPDRPAWDEPVRDTASDQGATAAPDPLPSRHDREQASRGDRPCSGVRRLADRPASRLALVETTDVQAATAALKADPAVLRVSVNHRYFRHLDPADETYFEELWGLHNTGQQLYPGRGRDRGPARCRHRRPPGPAPDDRRPERRRRGDRRRRRLQPPRPRRAGVDQSRRVRRRQGDQRRRRRRQRLCRRRPRLGLLQRRQHGPRLRRRQPRHPCRRHDRRVAERRRAWSAWPRRSGSWP